MAQGDMQIVVSPQTSTMFHEDELNRLIGVNQIDSDHIAIACGCKSTKYGDTSGQLIISRGGKLEILCECYYHPTEEVHTPAEFAKHAGKSNANTKWKDQIWVTDVTGLKISLRKTCLLKYHKEPFHRPSNSVHRDEFLLCTICYKFRRFHLRSEEQIKLYHDASLDPNWNCSLVPNAILHCEDEEERERRMVIRGCPKNAKCKGCENCMFPGCSVCRFRDCSCRSCLDFWLNENY